MFFFIVSTTSPNQPIVAQIETLEDKIISTKKVAPAPLLEHVRSRDAADTFQIKEPSVTLAYKWKINKLGYRLFDLKEEETRIVEGGK